jgi:threonine aldolase
MFGGGMRQAGSLAAAGTYALDHHVDRLADDHARARRLAESLAEMPGIDVALDRVQTNMVYIDLDPAGRSSAEWVEALQREGVLVVATSPNQLRAVTHLDVADAGIDSVIDSFARLSS